MYSICCITIFQFSILVLFIIVEAKQSFLNISYLKINSLKFNGINISYCSPVVIDPCIDNITRGFNWRSSQPYNVNDSFALTIDFDSSFEITAVAFLRSNNSDSKIELNSFRTFASDTTEFAATLSSNNLVMEFGLTRSCQIGYRGSKCNELDMCTRLPPNICQNHGSCSQKNDTIECICSDEFQGHYCHQLKDPCHSHSCSNNSSCVRDYGAKLQYRCTCTDGYKGLLCQELIDPCQINICGNNSKCIADKNETLQYRCRCNEGYTGRLCLQDVDRCALNKSLCAHFTNATCISKRDRHYCYCDGECKTIIPNGMLLPFKWPFSETISFSIVVIEGFIIVILIILVICVKKRYYNPIPKGNGNNLLPLKSDKEGFEFGSNYTKDPMFQQKIDKRLSINMQYEEHDMQYNDNNISVVSSPGTSTFGKR